MHEISINGLIKSGVFLSPSFKYELEVNHCERGTLMAKKMLHSFFTEYDLAYAGSLQSNPDYPGIDDILLASIESEYAVRCNLHYVRPCEICCQLASSYF